MLGSVVNTLEQRGEWLNGGRGAAKGMIDRLPANQVTPFGAAEHSEFFGAGGVCEVCANGFFPILRRGGDERTPARARRAAREDMLGSRGVRYSAGGCAGGSLHWPGGGPAIRPPQAPV